MPLSLLVAVFLVFFFSSISELPRSLDLALDRDPIFLRKRGGNRAGSSRKKPLRRPREGRKSLDSRCFHPPAWIHGKVERRVFPVFSTISLRGDPPTSLVVGVENPRCVREKDTGDCISSRISLVLVLGSSPPIRLIVSESR